MYTVYAVFKKNLQQNIFKLLVTRLIKKAKQLKFSIIFLLILKKNVRLKQREKEMNFQ